MMTLSYNENSTMIEYRFDPESLDDAYSHVERFLAACGYSINFKETLIPVDMGKEVIVDAAEYRRDMDELSRLRENNADDWIEWDGGECPVDPDTRVDVRFRSGYIEYNDGAGELPWDHGGTFGTAGDIVAYRVCE